MNSTNTSSEVGAVHHAAEVVTVISMAVGRSAAARVVADIAEVGPGDRVVDIGCGPGTAVREAARRGATATGVDPSPIMLRIATRTEPGPLASAVGVSRGASGDHSSPRRRDDGRLGSELGPSLG